MLKCKFSNSRVLHERHHVAKRKEYLSVFSGTVSLAIILIFLNDELLDLKKFTVGKFKNIYFL